MAAQPERSKWVGNAGLIIGLPYHKRKSLPRNSKGFEPIDGYFDRTSSPEYSDSDSSETDTEELVRQEREKRIEAEARKRAVQEAKKNAAYLMQLAAAKKQAEEAKAQQQMVSEAESEEKREEEEEKEETSKEPDLDDGNETLTEANAVLAEVNGGGDNVELVGGGAECELELGPTVEVFAIKSTSGSVVEGLYSPNTSAAVDNSPSSARKDKKLLPSRLSFSDVEEEQSSDKEHSDGRRSPRETKAKMNLQSSFLAVSDGLDTVPLPSGTAVIPHAGHISTGDPAFNPIKTSTQLKSRRKQQKGAASKRKANKSNAKKLPPSIRMELSDSESERDEALALLLADDTEHFQGLSQLVKSKKTNEPSGKSKAKPAPVSAKPAANNNDDKTRRFAKKSTGNRTGQKKSRKSVTFVRGSGSETDGEHQGQGKTKKTRTMAVTEPRSPGDDIYMSFDEDHFDSPKSYKPKRGGPKLTPPTKVTRKTRQSDTDEDSEYLADVVEKEPPKMKIVTPKRPTLVLERVPTRTKERRARVSESPESVRVSHSSRNLLKDVSAVMAKPMAPGQSSSQWFVPDMALPRKRKTTTKKSKKKDKFSAARDYIEAPPPSAAASIAVSEREVNVEYSDTDMQPVDFASNETRFSDVDESGLAPPPAKPITSTVLASNEGQVNGEDGAPKQKKKRGRLPKSKVAALASSESELEGERATKQGKENQDKKVTKGKRKKGQQHKTTSSKEADVASSESELDEWLASVRPNQQKAAEKEGAQRRKKKTEGAAKQSKVARKGAASHQSKLESIVQGLKSETTTRERRRSPRKTAQASASSESEIDVEPSQEESESQSDTSGPRQGKRYVRKTVQAESSLSESEQEKSESGGGQAVDSETGVSVQVTSLESGTEGASSGTVEVIHLSEVTKRKSKRRNRQTSATSESETGGWVQSTEEQETAPKQGRRQNQKSAHLAQASTTSESEIEESIKDVKRKGRVPSSKVASESEDGLSRPKKKKKSKVKVRVEDEPLKESERLAMEREPPQRDLSDYDVGGVSPPTPPSTNEEDVNVDSDTPSLTHPSYLKGDAGIEGEVEAAELSGTESIEISPPPQLNKRKRGRGKKLNIIPDSKKRKTEHKSQKPGISAQASSSPSVNAHVYSMSTSGEGDNMNGIEITRSVGGRRYRRHRVEPLKSHTPGVRRSSRTRIAPVRHWENEFVEYDLNKSGAVMKAVLVPLNDEESGGTESDNDRPRKRKGTDSGKATGKKTKFQEDHEFSPLRFSDYMGNTQELPIVHTYLSASRINCSGEPVLEKSDDDVIIHRLNSNQRSSKGLMTFAAHGEKPKSSTRTYDMFFYVLKGKLLFQVNEQEFTLFPYSSIDIPGGCVYSIRNVQHTEAQLLFTTHYIEPLESD